jgi:serine/threonine-protein kinase
MSPPSASPDSAERIIEDIQRIELLDAGHFEELARCGPSVGGDAPSLTQWMRERGWLSEYQADQLLTGQAHRLVLGVYRLIEPLGEGGMGHVFKARHQRLGRTVALKFIRPELIGGGQLDAVRRFQREARAAAQLMHPNVVTLYDADEIDGLHFIAMEYVDGTDLTRMVRKAGPLGVAQACDYARQAALGLQHASESGLVHRDIKPSNLLLSRKPLTDSGFVDMAAVKSRVPLGVFGQVKILDLGLARLTCNSNDDHSLSLLTHQGSVLGTPDFIAPEQARNPHGVDIRADIYSLGCTLYFMLAGHPPFPEGSAVEKLLKHQLDDPCPIEQVRTDCPPAVAVIVRRLMARKPADRFQTPVEAAAALEQVLRSADLANAAGRAVSLDKVLKPAAAAAAAAGDATARAAPPKPARPSTSERSLAGQMTVATAVGAHVASVQAEKVAVFQEHAGCLMEMAFSGDGRWLATAGIDLTVRIWDLAGEQSRSENLLAGLHGEPHALTFVEGQSTLMIGTCAPQGLLWRWDWASRGTDVQSVVQGDPGGVVAVALAPGADRVAVVGGRVVMVWNMAERRLSKRTVLKGHAQDLKAVAFAPDGRAMAVGGSDGVIDLWELGRFWWRQRNLLAGHHGAVSALAYSPDGKMLVSGGLDQTVRVWDPTGTVAEERRLLSGMHRAVRALRFLADGTRLMAADDAGHAVLWDVRTWTKLREWVVDQTLFVRVALSADGTHIATGGSDGSVILYRLAMP